VTAAAHRLSDVRQIAGKIVSKAAWQLRDIRRNAVAPDLC
jgi:hypothetical protein